jgi:hypothetical protein
VGPRAVLDAVVKRKIPSPFWVSNPLSSSPQPGAIPLSYPGSICTSSSSSSSGGGGGGGGGSRT